MGLAGAGYVIGLSWWQSRQNAFYEFDDLLIPRLIDLTIVSWLLYFGGAIGSFLNVVAWRMPRGDSISGRSKCPRCDNVLLARDNVPVLGWLSLAGRCRFCSLPISARYPIVEAAVGFSLTAIGITQLYSLALPYQSLHWHGGPLWAPQVDQRVIAILTYHTVALSTCWAMALIRVDGVSLPKSLVVFSLVVTAVPMIAFPVLMVTPWQLVRPDHWTAGGLYFDALLRVIAAWVAAALFARVLAKSLCPAADLKLDPLGVDTTRLIDLVMLLSVPAVLIGWQSMPAVVLMSAVIAVAIGPLLRRLPINDGPKGSIKHRDAFCRFAFAVPIALTIHLVVWRHLQAATYWPSEGSRPMVIVFAAMLTLTIPLWLRDPTRAVLGQPDVEEQDIEETESSNP
ncbi:Leader peptidase PppA [Stieleria varia]|uniref:Leader peptidase PppA n=2 Tax=Stieleria varia TaxID=2528005 RepID=A0A5C6A1S5_9BACT|nr:Leader peptidase PppA [Stieleria varia]